MHARWSWPRAMRLGSVVLTAGLVGCSLSGFPLSELQIPAELQLVLNDPAPFIAATDDPMEAVAPGTVTDDLAGLDGCWGTMFTEEKEERNLGLVWVIHFDRAAGRYSAWSTIGREAGGIWPEIPVISVEEGTFEVAGPALLRLHAEKVCANVDPATGRLTRGLREQTLDADSPARDLPALATLDGNRLLLYMGEDTPEDVDLDDEQPVFFRFDCP